MDKTMIEGTAAKPLTKKDFTSDQLVRWCPGCGDYAILSAMQNALAKTGKVPEEYVFVSGIGCSSRFPYYMDTYGFHSIHGRAPAIASGVKLANPELTVWQITGDGDALSIGGNHLIHALRRNIDINILLFNNRIYGLTKGQFSPTSEQGTVTKSSPQGSLEVPFNAGELALGAKSQFFARVSDKDIKPMTELFIQAESFEGTSFIEVLQNCPIFNDKVHEPITAKEVKADAQIFLEHGKPMLFGKDKEKGLKLNGLKIEVVTIGENGITEDDILIHNAHEEDNALHVMLAKMEPPYPVAMGIIRAVKTPTFNETLFAQIDTAKASSKFGNVDDLLNSGETWEI